jgi:beta-glucosidase
MLFKFRKQIHLLALAFFSFTYCFSQTQYPFQNTSLSFEQRVNDLVSRLTLEEKVAQMSDVTPAIPRLGIPAYDWWNEVLHGVARTPYHVTSYPQAIAMAATFDTSSIKLMGDYSATEGRAIYEKANREGRAGQRYVGLTYWTPNINIFRDPRWGLGQETYGEDPFLTAMMGKAFVHGLQGDDPKYLKAAGCAKHYAVHSGPEPIRHSFDVTPTKYDLWNTYLPAFKELTTKANVAGVMCAYNAYASQPCCGSDLLMTDILRNRWKFTGYVTSDCGALDDFFNFHKTHPDAVSASADALYHGTDVDCGNVVYKTLLKTVQEGKTTEQQIDISLKRLFMIRFRLGMFDPPSMVKYANTPETVLEGAEHKAHALKMAQQSIVLLKNDNNTLPLKKNIKKVAVVGPNSDNAIAVLGNYNGMPSKIVTALEGIKAKLGSNVEVVYEKAINFTNDTLLRYSDVSSQFSWQGKKGFYAEYFNNKELKGEPIATRNEEDINHLWQEGQIVVDTLKANNFSVRYSTEFKATKNGDITFEVNADDGYRFLIDGKEALNAWTRNRWGARTYKLNTEANKTYKLVLETNQGDGGASVLFHTGDFTKTDFAALANKIKDADAIVFVMLTGSAIALPWESQNIPAIINSWYGGQSAGTALADVLFGDYNPAGRLPVTFYKSDNDLPSFTDYSMSNRTYRYFKGVPLYGFGYGLSYTTFMYDQLKLAPSTIKGKTVPVSVRVKNTGKKDGEEVVQLYVSSQDKAIQSPLKALKGFQRIFLKAGESKTVQFNLSPEDLSIIDDNGNPKEFSGKVTIAVGGGQPDTKLKTTSNVVKGIINIL